MARPKEYTEATERVFLRLPADAAALLDQLAPSERKRGLYVADLIRRAAQEAGLIPATEPPGDGDDLAAQVADLRRRVSELEQRAE